MANVIDLRSDTVTVPTLSMRRAMAEAEVGDDVFGEDPTVNRLQARAAELLGTEDALFVPSGTMGNEIAIKVHTRPGQEILVDEDSHIIKWELGGVAALSGVQTRTLAGSRGIVDPAEYARRVHPGDEHSPRTGLICLENTHNAAGGVVLPFGYMEEISRLARDRGVPMHLDGARLFNALAVLRVSPDRVAGLFDSIMFCLSKGLGCPVGSLLCGTRSFIHEARHVRRLLGGGMRQAGIIAAAGLVALDEMIERVVDDHRRARRLAEALAVIDGFGIDLETVQTNMVYVKTRAKAAEVVRQVQASGVRCINIFEDTIRLVVHKDVDDEDITRTIVAFAAAARV